MNRKGKTGDQILNETKDLYSRWPELTPEEKRKIVENITEKITIGKEDVTINLCYLPSPKTMTSKQRKLNVTVAIIKSRIPITF